jgi:hypothetical protein
MVTNNKEMLALECSQCFDIILTADGQATCCRATHHWLGDRSGLRRINTARIAA